jgi:hypothetical protein
MFLSKLNTMTLALIFSLPIEGIGTGVYYWLASSFSPGTFADRFCDLYLFIHKPATKLAQVFFPANHWPGVAAHIWFYIFALWECWILLFALIWILKRFYKRLDGKRPAA